MLHSQATSLQLMSQPFMYAKTIPKDAYDGAEEINEPRISALAISVMYTMAGLVPHAIKKYGVRNDLQNGKWLCT